MKIPIEKIEELEHKYGSLSNVPENDPKLIELRDSIYGKDEQKQESHYYPLTTKQRAKVEQFLKLGKEEKTSTQIAKQVNAYGGLSRTITRVTVERVADELGYKLAKPIARKPTGRNLSNDEKRIVELRLKTTQHTHYSLLDVAKELNSYDTISHNITVPYLQRKVNSMGLSRKAWK